MKAVRSSDGHISQEMDFMFILPDVTVSEGDTEALHFSSVESTNPGYVNLKVLDATQITLQGIPVLDELFATCT